MLKQAGILASPRSLSAQYPSQPDIPVNPRSQSAQDPSQPWMPSCLFGSCLFGIWLMTIWYLGHAYRGSSTYTKITKAVSTTTVFGLCTCKWGDFGVSRGLTTVPLTQISCDTVFSKSQNACKVGTFCTHKHCHKFQTGKTGKLLTSVYPSWSCRTFFINKIFKIISFGHLHKSKQNLCMTSGLT